MSWTISPAERRVFAKAEGLIVAGDIYGWMDAVMTADALSYGKLIDARNIDARVDDREMMELGARGRAYTPIAPNGPVALVMNPGPARDYVLRYLNLTTGDRPAQVFADMAAARRWLDNQVAP